MKKQKHWFKRKRYGYGWTPTTIQGYIVIILYLIVVLGGSLMIKDVPDGEFTSEVGVFLLVMAIATTSLIHITVRKGPKAKWRWGKKSDDNPEEDW